MFKTLCIAEKLSLAEAAGRVLADMRGVQPEFDWTTAKSKQYNQVGDVKFVWLDGHAFMQAMPDHYLPDSVPFAASGKKKWRVEDLPVVPKKWEILPNEKKARRLSIIEADLKTCELVWHMGDPDAEGQVLVDECLEFFRYNGKVKRVLINDYNATPVKAALNNMRDNDEPMFRAWHFWGVARGRYDWLFGLNSTRAMTLRGRALGHDGLLPVGSVQTPLLYVVRERDRLIEEFKPVPYFTISATLKHEDVLFLAKWKPQEEQQGRDPEGRLLDATIASGLVSRLTGKTGTFTEYTKTKKQQKSPITLSMNELQIEGFKKFGYSGQQVLDAGQKLYEIYKVMSYPRSDNRYLSLTHHAAAPSVMEAVFKLRPDLAGLALDASRKSDAFNDKKTEGTPHHGLIPTIPESPVNPVTWTEEERNIYDIVVRSYLAQFAAPFEYFQTSIEANVDGEMFTASGRTPISEGWKAVYAEADQDGTAEAEADGKQTLPIIAKGDAALCEKCEQKSQKTKPLAYFDDGMLTECMMNIHKYVTDEAARKRLKEGDGIGTTATRAAMVQEMKDRELFVPLNAKSAKLKTSDAARALIDALPLEVKDPATAGAFKSALDRVASAADPDAALRNFETETVAFVTRIVEQSRTVSMTLPVSQKAASAAPVDKTHPCSCGKGFMQLKKGKSGAFWGCSSYPVCTITLPDNKGKPSARPAPIVIEKIDAVCPKCGNSMVKRNSVRGAFLGCSTYPKCNGTKQYAIK